MKVKRPKFLFLFFIPMIASGMMMTPAAAATSHSSSPSTNQTGPQGQPVELQFKDGTTLYKPNWTQSGAEFTFESKIPTSLTIVDMNSIGDTGSGDVATKTIRLSPNKPKTIQMDLVNKAGSKGVTISNGKQMKYTSNPRKPLFEQIFHWMLYAGILIAPIEVAVFTVGIIWSMKRKLRKDPMQVG